MKRAITIAAALALGTSQAIAAVCPVPGGHQLSAAVIQTLLVGNYACVGASPNAQWNELHMGGASGKVLDYKLGPSSPTDPSDTSSNPTGTYSISGSTITYQYGGQSFSYNIDDRPSGSVYTFCQTPSNIQLSVTVQAGHC